MTGTSMDGIDISLVKTNGIDLKRLNKNFYYEYTPETKKILNEILKKNINVSLKPYTGVTLSKSTICNLNFPKNALIMQLETDDIDFDIEKNTDETI